MMSKNSEERIEDFDKYLETLADYAENYVQHIKECVQLAHEVSENE